MSRKKVIFSIFLLAALVAAGIALPSYWRAEKQKKQVDNHKPPITETDIQDQTEETLELSYEGFDGLTAFFSNNRIDDLKSLFPVYFNDTGRTVTTVTFLPEKTEYPDGGNTKLYFLLSDGTELPVTCSTSSGAFFFGEEQTRMQTKDSSYERVTDDTLPSYSADDISSMQEGGYADTGDDTLPEEFQEESEIPQMEIPAPTIVDTTPEEEVLP